MHKTAFNNIEHAARSHQLELVAGVDLPLLKAHIDYNALVAVVVAVEDKRAKRSVCVALGRGNVADDFFKHSVNVDARLCRDFRRVLGGNAYNVLDLFYNSVRVGARQVDFIYYRHDLKTAVNGKVSVR